MESALKLNLSLKDFAVVRVGIILLEKDFISQKIIEILKKPKKGNRCIWKYKTDPALGIFRSKVKELLGTIMNQIEMMDNIPKSLGREIKYIIPKLTERKISWLRDKQMKKSLSNVNYPSTKVYSENLCWTCFGTVDEVKTFESMYRQHQEEIIHCPENERVDSWYLFVEACYYCLRSYIIELWNSYSESEKKSYYKFNKNRGSPLVTFWIEYLTRGPAISIILPEMKDLCISDGNLAGVEFFHNEIENLEGRRDRVKKLSDEALCTTVQTLIGHHMKTESCLNWRISHMKHIDVIVYLFRRLSLESKKIVLRENFPYFNRKIGLNPLCNLHAIWPWKIVILPMLNTTWDFLEVEEFRLYFERIHCVEMEYELAYKHEITDNPLLMGIKESEIRKSYHSQILYDLWDVAPCFLKRGFISNPKNLTTFAEISRWNGIAFFIHILNDIDVDGNRDIVLETSAQFCSSALSILEYSEYSFFYVKCFIENVFKNNEERAHVKEELVFLVFMNSLCGTDFSERIKIVPSWFYVEDDFVRMKKNLTHEKCRMVISSIYKKYRSIENKILSVELQWFFNFINYSSSEIMALKYFLKNDKEFINGIKELMNTEDLPSIEASLINSFMFTKEEVDQINIIND